VSDWGEGGLASRRFLVTLPGTASVFFNLSKQQTFMTA
jgi:hypothetical protein